MPQQSTESRGSLEWPLKDFFRIMRSGKCFCYIFLVQVQVAHVLAKASVSTPWLSSAMLIMATFIIIFKVLNLTKIDKLSSHWFEPGNAHLNSEGGSISTADLLVLTG